MSACDLVVAADQTRIGYPEVHRGLVAGLVLSLLNQQVGPRRTRELVLLGRWIDAPTACKWHLVNRVVPEAQLHAESLNLAAGVLQGGPVAIARTKQIMRELSGRPLAEDLENALHHHLRVRQSSEAQEGLAAYLNKREPSWWSAAQNPQTHDPQDAPA